MNQFRDILIAVFIFMGLSLMLSNPLEWNWIVLCGTTVVSAVHWLVELRPWSYFACFALALALFMTRIRY